MDRRSFLIHSSMAAWALTLPCRTSAADAAEAPTILVLGDSLSAGYGLDREAGWVALLQRRIEAESLRYRVVNASISGDTTAGGLARLPAALDRNKPAWVLVELGGNDGLRALPVARMQDNLERIVKLCHDAGARTLLFEMRIPSNYGAAYTRQFTETYAQVARAGQATLVPFFLAQVAQDPALFQDDGIHPGPAAQPLMLDAVWQVLGPLLRR